MNYLNIEQKSQAWWDYKVGKISGTRFGQLISSRENMLIDEFNYFLEYKSYVPYFNDIRLKYEINDLPF